MKKIFLIVLALLLIGGFSYFALIDIPVETQPTTRTIPNDRFFESP